MSRPDHADDVAYGNGHCGVCDKPSLHGRLMCMTCWRGTPKGNRRAVLLASTRWHANQITLGQLRRVQDAAVDACRAASV